MTSSTNLLALLSQLEASLKDHQLWQFQPPEPQMLQSTEPFAIDILTPQQWLQWIFLPRMRALLASGNAVPKGFAVAPYFEEVWKLEPQFDELIETIRAIDSICQ
ncbi:YqcC family protein [Vibrio sp. CAU 1672]|uniref:YqcC family protein n=1 Tax=Vibrio sp. CAU 1672 TaxID=3032594 RepID=UPI0023DC9118|nr:YqcC family protein [Vibrio sp. CAU 1672]MDF2155546.1 YqcC family protein [Vibrio sp. CAU 1672]